MILKKILQAPILFYKRFISPNLPRRCRYYPTCSAYALQAIEKHGAVKGLILSAWRLLRCNPFSAGGIDDVPERFKDAFIKKRGAV